MESKSESKPKIQKLEEINLNEDSINNKNNEFNNNTKNCGQYSRQSFDRFGDDLCELLLSYLTFKDKIIFENVCKQWKRCVYNKQRVLQIFSVRPVEEVPHLQNVYLNDLLVPIVVKNFVSGYANSIHMQTINKSGLKSLLIKCKFINKIELTRVFIDSLLLHMIGTYCPHLESIQLDLIGLEEEDLISFGEKYGKRLKYIKFTGNIRSILGGNVWRDYANKFCNIFGKKLLIFCSNIKSFICDDITAIAEQNVDFLPKLESLELKLRRIDALNFTNLVNKYELKMKKLKIYSNELDIQNLRNSLTQIARFRNIQDLNICFSVLTNTNSNITDKVMEMSKTCTKLKRLVFNINSSIAGNEVISGNIFEFFGKLTHLKHLSVSFQINEINETVECLKRLTQLTHLIIKSPKIDELFFKDIDLYLPNLKSISISTDHDLSDVIMISLSKLKDLSSLRLGSGHKSLKLITDTGVSKLINSCEQLREITFYSRPYITAVTIDNLIAFANKKSKSIIRFYCGFSRTGDEASFATIDMNSFKNIPINLLMTIRTGPPVNNPVVLPEFGPNVHVIEFNLNANHNPPPINFQELHQLLLQQHGFVQNILNLNNV